MVQVVEGGQVTQSGNYKELLTKGTTFEQLVFAHESTIGSFDTSSGSNRPLEDSILQLERKDSSPHSKEEEFLTNPRTQLTEEEQKVVGDVGWKAFVDYISISKGLLHCCSSTVAQCAFVAFQAAASFWLAFAVQDPKRNSLFIVGIYTLISFLSAVFVYFRTLFAVLLGLKASQAFFSGFINSVFDAPMLFFDSTPVGRILTRVRFSFLLTLSVFYLTDIYV